MKIPLFEASRSSWGTNFRKSLIIVLFSVLLVALTFVNSCTTEIDGPEYQDLIEIEDVEITRQQLELERPPEREVNAEVVEVDEDEIIEEKTLINNQLNEKYIPEVPEIEPVDTVPLIFLEEQPVPVNQVNPRYPDLAKKGGVEGTVLVEIIIGTDGNVESARIVDSRPKGFFEEAALEASRQWKFTPAYQRDKPVKVLYQIPFNFRLR